MAMNALKQDNGNWSSIRIALLLCVIADIWLIALMSFDMIQKTIHDTPQDWQGLAAFMAAIAAFTGGGFGFKALQKKYENDNS
jgi:hypothetical protein